MFGPVFLNILAISRWVLCVASTPQGYYRSGSRYDDVYANKEGTYRTFGRLGGTDEYDGRSIGYGRRRYGGTCPYDNEKTFRKKREVTEYETVEVEKPKTTSNTGIFLQRLRRHDAYYRDAGDLYNDNRDYNDRDRYREDRNRDVRYIRYYEDNYKDRDDQQYRRRYDDRDWDDQQYRRRYYDRFRDKYNDDFGGRSVGSYGRDRCGREFCNWEAELECDLSKIGGGYGRYRSDDRVRWERENDAYYPRDKYEDLRDYFGTRMSLEDDGRLIITRVRPEDKGVYRCYAIGGAEADFMEIHFFPKFPVDTNAVDSRDC